MYTLYFDTDRYYFIADNGKQKITYAIIDISDENGCLYRIDLCENENINIEERNIADAFNIVEAQENCKRHFAACLENQ